MALFNKDKLNVRSSDFKNTQRGNYQWKDKSQEEVIWVPNKNGRFLISI